ncbi:MAG: alpha/beta fold hydrolase [Vicinamibacterales bacterium]
MPAVGPVQPEQTRDDCGRLFGRPTAVHHAATPLARVVVQARTTAALVLGLVVLGMVVPGMVVPGTLGGAGAVLSGQDAPRPDVRLVDVGARRLHLRCEGIGSPLVILESGLGASADTWAAVQPAVAADTRTCAYDRAGLGRSDPAPPGRRTGRDAVTDLAAMLKAAGLSGPMVLVAHSFGGVIAREFARAHPADVAGLVLVDSTHERQDMRLAAAGFPQGGTSRSSREPIDVDASLAAARRQPWRADIPLRVIAAGRTPYDRVSEERRQRFLRVWRDELQQDLASRSALGRLLVAEHSGHAVQRDEPAIVIDAVREVVRVLRRSR